MTRDEIIKEDLLKTDHSLGFAISNLQEALRQATAVESIFILKMINDASRLLNDVNQLRGAM